MPRCCSSAGANSQYLQGNFRKQQHSEISHWNEWKHWVHARAVESHDFEDRCRSCKQSRSLVARMFRIPRGIGEKCSVGISVLQKDVMSVGCLPRRAGRPSQDFSLCCAEPFHITRKISGRCAVDASRLPAPTRQTPDSALT